MSTEYTLTYYDARGLAESARLILAYGGAKWNDVRIPFVAPGQSPLPDDVKARLRFGQVPLLEFNSKRLVQSQAIFRYLAKQFNLTGKDDFEAAQCDEIVDAVKDAFQAFMPAMLEADQAKKAEIARVTVENVKTRFLSKFNESIEKNGGYVVGKSLTWADIVITAALEQLQKRVGVNLSADFPALVKLSDTVNNAPGIKEYLAKRPQTEW